MIVEGATKEVIGMDWNSLLSGLGGVIVGALISYWGQSRLVNRQIKAAEKTQREISAMAERSNQELIGLLQEVRNMLNTRFGQMSSSLANLESKIDVR